MRILAADLQADVGGYIQEVLSSTPQFPDGPVVNRTILQSADEIHPMLPNGWHDNESTRVAPINLAVTSSPVIAPPLYAGLQALPSDCLELDSFDLCEVGQRTRVVYNGAEFAAIKAQMGAIPVPGMLTIVFYQEGRNLRYWHVPAATKWAYMRYTRRSPNPSATGGYFEIAERAVPLVVAHAAATLKLKDLRPEDSQVLWARFIQKWQMAVVGQATKIANDPFTLRGKPIVPVGGGQQ